jgi:hypothetical protein
MQLALRNAVAALIVEALADPAAGAHLRGLADLLAAGRGDAAPALRARLLAAGIAAPAADAATALVIRPAFAAERGAAAARARVGLAAAERHWRTAAPGRDALQTALARSAVLFAAGLFFEVHEVLEAAWNALRGETRTFVQGLIQVAVALHHLEHGNPSGARTLLAAGRAKLAPHAPEYCGVDVQTLLDGLAPLGDALARGVVPPTLPLPVLRVR